MTGVVTGVEAATAGEAAKAGGSGGGDAVVESDPSTGLATDTATVFVTAPCCGGTGVRKSGSRVGVETGGSVGRKISGAASVAGGVAGWEPNCRFRDRKSFSRDAIFCRRCSVSPRARPERTNATRGRMITPPTSARTTRMTRPSMISWRPVDPWPRRQRKHGAGDSSKEIHDQSLRSFRMAPISTPSTSGATLEDRGSVS